MVIIKMELQDHPKQLKKELANSMRALSLTSTNHTSLSKVDTIMESHGNQSSIDLPLAPPTSNKFHAYLTSSWK